MKRTTTTRTTAVVATVLATGLLAGCAEELPTPKPEAPVAAAVVTQSQEREILDKVAEVVGKVEKSRDADSLAARLDGPALSIRETQLEVADARGDKEPLTDLAMEMQQVILPSDQDWPRSSFAITVQPKDLTTPVLMAFDQATARDQYKLWGWVRLLPGVTMPQFAEADLGSPAVPEDDESLKVTPEDAIKQYASVLTVDKDSKYAENFADDDLRQFFRDYGKLQVDAINKEECGGSFEVEYEPTKDPVKAVRTADGGALVLASMISQETITAKEEGCEIGPPTKTTKALWGDTEVSNVVEVNYEDMVAMYVPPKDSEDEISLVGYEHVPSSVSNG
ncbi:hypothetical protein APR04_003695 [Promicromonospora umidemergens]|uniref:DUF8094 domain-containing protein n=1 Tax=Promicromonospora umidemergens TaxID=629679 RepID=A0ABP8YA64_9MICO|nr:THO complex subunit 4 [Promicromonospora umidemergens]MCP2284772.1 hypothetical protein [Promicromonospora umidemergens]